ncbi:MAG: hypothetical protein ACKV22_40890 [Bryobacteraceae bacterium]
MDDHVTELELEGYRRRRLAPTDLLRVDDHLAACEHCRLKLAGQMDLPRIESAWREEIGQDPVRSFPVRSLGMAAAAVLLIGSTLFLATRDRHRIVAQLRDGSRVLTIDSKGQMKGIEGVSQHQTLALAAALRDSRLDLPAWTADLAGRTETLMGERPAAGNPLIGPLGTAVLDDRPRFRWRPMAGATTYTVVIQNESGGESISSGPLEGTDWKPANPLNRGATYSWQLSATVSGVPVLHPHPPQPPARFRVVDDRTAAALRELPDSHALRGVLYAQAGLLEAAEREFERLYDQNPESPAARAWLESLRKARTRE